MRDYQRGKIQIYLKKKKKGENLLFFYLTRRVFITT